MNIITIANNSHRTEWIETEWIERSVCMSMASSGFLSVENRESCVLNAISRFRNAI